MSLAMYAAPFDDDQNYMNDNNIINKKKQTHNKTQKIYNRENFDQNKVNSVLESIHKQSTVDDDENNLGNFNPPPKPESIGAIKKHMTENMQNMTNMFVTGNAPKPNNEIAQRDDLDLNNYSTNYISNENADEYYNTVLPKIHMNSNKNNLYNKNYYSTNNPNLNNYNDLYSSQDILMKKLNYMITLLEEQQDEKTENVTEEVVLYSFLGIFIIFVVDSFAKVGKYVR